MQKAVEISRLGQQSSHCVLEDGATDKLSKTIPMELQKK